MKIVFALLTAAMIAVPQLDAEAAPINVNTWYHFGFEVGSDFTSGVGIVAGTNPVSIEAPDPAWTFTLATAGTLTVLDLFLSTDRFEIFDLGSSLGWTSAPTDGASCYNDITCALADNRYSRGVFNLAAGDHSITGRLVSGYGGGGAFVVEAAAVPVPASLLLLLSALGLTGGVARVLRRA